MIWKKKKKILAWHKNGDGRGQIKSKRHVYVTYSMGPYSSDVQKYRVCVFMNIGVIKLA